MMKKRGRRGFASSMASLLYHTCSVWNKCNSSLKKVCVHQCIWWLSSISKINFHRFPIFPLLIQKVNLRLSCNYDWTKRHKDTRRFLQSVVARRPPRKQLPEPSLSLQAPLVRRFPPVIDSWKRGVFFQGDGKGGNLVLCCLHKYYFL